MVFDEDLEKNQDGSQHTSFSCKMDELVRMGLVVPDVLVRNGGADADTPAEKGDTANTPMFVKKKSYTEQEMTDLVGTLLKKNRRVYDRLAEI